ncbi:uncharacterized protein LOC144488534 isoform X2 [Mustelus asterias]
MSLTDDCGFLRGPEGMAALPLPEDGLLLPCFHGFASRREAEELLQGKPLGSFLLRLSESQAGMVLSYSGTDRCRHFIIEQMPEKRYRILGDQRLHKSIPELLEFYKSSPILPFIEYLTIACNKVPDKHYEDIDRIRRRKMNAREAGEGGVAAGDIPNVPEDGAGLTWSPGTLLLDPKATHDARPWAVEGSAKVTAEEATYQEVPDKHYQDIDRIWRRKMNAREAGGGGVTAGDIPNVPEDGAGLTWSPGTPPFDPRTEVPDKHYEDIDRIRRRKMNAREAGGGGVAAGDIPNVPEDGAGLTWSSGTPPFDPSAEVPETHYQDIDKIRRRKMNAREAGGGGVAAGDIPNVPEDGAGLTWSPGTPPFDPRAEVPETHYEDIDKIRRRKMNAHEAGGGGVTAGDIPNVSEDGAGLTWSPGTPPFDPRTEVPDKHYEDIDRIRRRKMNAREAGGGGVAAGDIPNVPEDGAGLTWSPGTPPFDPRTEVPETHYEAIDKIRRRKMNAHEAGGGGVTAGDIPNVSEDGAGLTWSPGTPPFDPRTEVPDKHYEDIDRIRRWKMNAREAGGGGVAAGDIPNVSEDGAGLTWSPGTPPFDPRTEVLDKHYEAIDKIRRRKMNAREAGGGGVTAGDIPNVSGDGAGFTWSPGMPPFDPRTEVPDKHYEDIDRIRRCKMNAREAGGGGVAAGDIPNVPEDGAGLTWSPGTPPFDPRTEVPDKHYEDIDRIRRRKMNAREAGGGGVAAGDIPNVPEDGAGLTWSPGTPPFDPRTEVPDKHYEDIDRIRRRKMNAREAGGGGVTAGDIPNVPEDGAGLTWSLGTPPFDPRTEVPDKHYQDIDRIRRQKMNACEAGGGGVTAGDIPNVPEDGAGLTWSPGTPTFDPMAMLDARSSSVEGSAKVKVAEATHQEILEGRTLVRNASNKDLSSRPTETVTYTKVNKTHVYTEPGPRPCGNVDRTHTYAEPTQAPLYADPNDKIVLYTASQDLLPRARGHQCHHVYSELDPKLAGRGNLYCPAPTKSSAVTPDLPPRQPADNPRGEMMPSAPPRWPTPPLVPPGVQPTYAQPARRGPPAARGLAGDAFELDNTDYGVLPRPAACRPEPAVRPGLEGRPGPGMRPVPEVRPETALRSCPETRPGPETWPGPEGRPSQETRPVLMPKPGPETRLVPETRPRQEMRPLPVPRLGLTPRPGSEMRPVPEVKPETELRACPEMRPSQETRLVSETRPVPVPRPGPETRPVLMPRTVSEARPILTPRTVPRPDPTPRPVPRPDPTPRPAPMPRPIPEARPAPTPRPNHTTLVPALIQPENLYERVPEEYLRPPPFAPSRPTYRRDL